MKFNEQYVLRTLENKTVLAFRNSETEKFSKVIKLNEVAEVIVKGLKRGLSKEEIVASILEKFNVDEATVLKDYQEFLKELLELGVISND